MKILKDQGWTCVKIDKTQTGLFSGRYSKMFRWCEINVGMGRVEPSSNWLDTQDNWYAFNFYDSLYFWFKYDKDATMFLLKCA